MFNFFRKLDQIFIKLFLGLTRPGQVGGEAKITDVKNILVIKLWGLGNLIVISPLLHKIKDKFPHARVMFLTFETNKGFFEYDKAVDRVIYFGFTTNPYKVIRQVCTLVRELKQQKIDIILNFETFNNMSALFAYWINAPIRIGLHNRYEGRFYTHPVSNNKSRHISDVFTDLLLPLGISGPYKYGHFEGSDGEKSRVMSELGARFSGKFVVIHPSTSMNFLGKRFSEQGFSLLADMLIVKYGLTVILTGTRGDRHVADNVIAGMKNKDKVFDVTGCFTLGELTELLKKSRLFISNDTGPVHLAASAGVNVAAIYGPTTPLRFGPLNRNSFVFYKGISCSPCVGVDYLNIRCKNGFKCLDFSAEEIFNKLSERFLDVQ